MPPEHPLTTRQCGSSEEQAESVSTMNPTLRSVQRLLGHNRKPFEQEPLNTMPVSSAMMIPSAGFVRSADPSYIAAIMFSIIPAG